MNRSAVEARNAAADWQARENICAASVDEADGCFNWKRLALSLSNAAAKIF
jgi:hypothetical protein